MHIDGDWYLEHIGDKFEYHKGDTYIKEIGETYIEKERKYRQQSNWRF